MSAKSGEVFFEDCTVLHFLVYINLFRNRICPCAVVFDQKIRTHLTRVIFVTDEEIHLVGYSSATVAHNSNTRKLNVLSQCDNVKIVCLVGEYILTVLHFLNCVYTVTELCGFFKLKILRCFVHLLGKTFYARLTAVLHILYCRVYKAVVFVLLYLAGTNAHTSFYMIIKARTLFPEISRKDLVTGREHKDSVDLIDRLLCSKSARERAEILRILIVAVKRIRNSRIWLFCDFYIIIALIVL